MSRKMSVTKSAAEIKAAAAEAETVKMAEDLGATETAKAKTAKAIAAEKRAAKAAEATKTSETETIAEKTPKKSKKRAYKSKGADIGDTGVKLTPKQIDFMKTLADDEDFQHGNETFIPAFSDSLEVAVGFNAMTTGAMVSTLREKGLLLTGKMKNGSRTESYFVLTILGHAVLKAL